MKSIMKYGRLVVFVRHDFAEIWGFGYGFTFGIATLKIMASTGVFVSVECALKRSISFLRGGGGNAQKKQNANR
jgi:hypothetical protein